MFFAERGEYFVSVCVLEREGKEKAFLIRLGVHSLRGPEITKKRESETKLIANRDAGEFPLWPLVRLSLLFSLQTRDPKAWVIGLK